MMASPPPSRAGCERRPPRRGSRRPSSHRLGQDSIGGVRTVLIVDDHPEFVAAAGALLRSEGLRVVGRAATGAEALAEAARLRPDLVLLDVRLPDSDGFAVARRLAGLGDAAGRRADLQRGGRRPRAARGPEPRRRVPPEGGPLRGGAAGDAAVRAPVRVVIADTW